FTISPENAVKRNIENMIGCVQIPVGVAGPLKVKGNYADGEYWIPLATTEGALVASINRGASAITKTGGAEVRVSANGMSRAPVFIAKDIVHAYDAVRWIEDNFELISQEAKKTTSHGNLASIFTTTAGTSVYVRMVFTTGDAMGMNMATIAAEAAAKIIEKKTGIKLIASSGNLCCDKKPAAVNTILGRGKTVSAGIFLHDEILHTILKTNADALIEVNIRKNLIGSARAASLGFNAHAANVAAALFLATGQDAAHVVEASTTLTTVDKAENGVYVSVTIPDLPVGTVGGGTHLPCQHEALAMLGCTGDNTALKFAEIVAVAILAGEISLLSALAEGQLGKSHQTLGRG
ncbi:MAG TPA: hydroxymethylglutaryl-CoA reductase (NADPH), partial [Methanocorpusculum sp.]|nr:hydroxymethylglutaryl-CoA reductase (NADPH) [Methanocorpusculum sp.]